MKIQLLLILSLFLFLSNEPTQARNYSCTYQSMSGTQSISYNDYYLKLYEAYKVNQSENSRFLKNLQVQVAKGLIQACPDFYKRIREGELPMEGNSSGNKVVDFLKDEYIKRDDTFKKLRNEHPRMKRWLSRLD